MVTKLRDYDIALGERRGRNSVKCLNKLSGMREIVLLR